MACVGDAAAAATESTEDSCAVNEGEPSPTAATEPTCFPCCWLVGRGRDMAEVVVVVELSSAIGTMDITVLASAV